MCKTWKEQCVVVLTVIILTMLNAACARPRRRFCENYPFAPRCLGVAAKRSLHLQTDQTPLDIYSKVIKSVLEEAHRTPSTFTDVSALEEKQRPFHDSTLWDKLVELVQETEPEVQQRQPKYKRSSFMDVDDSWDDTFNDGQDGL